MLSYCRGADRSLLNNTIGEQLDRVAAAYPDCLALVSRHQHFRLTWAELRGGADRLARGLLRLGLRHGDRVGICSGNCWEWVVTQLACARSGMVLVNINPSCRLAELVAICRKSKVKTLFLQGEDGKRDTPPFVPVTLETTGMLFEQSIVFGTAQWDTLFSNEPLETTNAVPSDVALIQYSSGTTGVARGVLLTHLSVVNNGSFAAEVLGYQQHDRICIPVPMAHCFGCVVGTMSALATGAAMIFPNSSFDALKTLQVVEEEKASSIFGVPTMFVDELCCPQFGRFNLTSLQSGIIAGAPCHAELVRRVIVELDCPKLAIGYGLTETSPVLTMSDMNDDIIERISTVGKVMPCTELKVVSQKTGNLLGVGLQGEICARGYMLMQGYDGEPEATSLAIDGEGWLHSGDLGLMQSTGYIQVTGRAKDMIIRGGENIDPREVEDVLHSHPKLAEAYVTGLPDERLGETVLAWVRLRPNETTTADEIREFCRGPISHFKIPHKIRCVKSFPTSAYGKVQKSRIRRIEIWLQRRQSVSQDRLINPSVHDNGFKSLGTNRTKAM